MIRVALAFGIALLTLAPGDLPPSNVAPAQQQPSPAIPSANPADVSSTDAVVNAAYDAISGPAGEGRDWDRFRSLFIAEARFVIAAPSPSGGVGARVLDMPSFISGFTENVGRAGFFEKGIAQRTERYGNIAHVFSTYEARRSGSDPKPFARGVNSFQLLNDGKRWWIVDIYWQQESPSNLIPKRYLSGRS